MSIATEAATAPPAVQTEVTPGSIVDPGNHSASTGNSSTLAAPPAKVNLSKPKVLRGWYKIRALGKKNETRRETLTMSFSKQEHSSGNVSPGIEEYNVTASGKVNAQSSFMLHGPLLWNPEEQSGKLKLWKTFSNWVAGASDDELVVLDGTLSRVDGVFPAEDVPVKWVGEWAMNKLKFEEGDRNKFEYTDRKKTKKAIVRSPVQHMQSPVAPRERVARKRAPVRKHLDSEDMIPLSDVMKKCLGVLNHMEKHKNGFHFKEAVDKSLVPDYYEGPRKIVEPICLNQIRVRLETGYYNNSSEHFARDMRLVWHNCMVFNSEATDPWHQGAVLASEDFEKKFKKVFEVTVGKERRAFEITLANYEREKKRLEDNEDKRVAKEQKKLEKIRKATEKKREKKLREKERKRKAGARKSAQGKTKRNRASRKSGGGGLSAEAEARIEQLERYLRQTQTELKHVRRTHGSSKFNSAVSAPRGGAARVKAGKKKGARPLTADEKAKLVDDIGTIGEQDEDGMQHIIQMIKDSVPGVEEDGGELSLDLDVLNDEYPKLVRNIKKYVAVCMRRIRKKMNKPISNIQANASQAGALDDFDSAVASIQPVAHSQSNSLRAEEERRRNLEIQQEEMSQQRRKLEQKKLNEDRRRQEEMRRKAAQQEQLRARQAQARPKRNEFSDDSDDDGDANPSIVKSKASIQGWSDAASENARMVARTDQMQMEEVRLAQEHRQSQAQNHARLMESTQAIGMAARQQEEKRLHDEEMKRKMLAEQREQEAAERLKQQAPLFQSNEADREFGSLGDLDYDMGF